jgi:hypothetical protein
LAPAGTALIGLLAAPAARADDPLTFRGSLSWLNVYEHTTPLASAVNPENTVLEVPSDSVVSELRPSLKVLAGPLQLVARPRVRYTEDQTREDDHTGPARGRAEAHLNEAFGQWTLSESATLVYGIQSYQWGAAESLSPSNQIFHDTALQRDLLFEVEGRDIARMNFSVGKHFSTVVMGEVQENKDAPVFVADEPFQTTGLVKSEINWDNGADYIGVVGGGHEHGHPWVGEYFSVVMPSIFDGFTLYGDMAQQRGSDAWYPVVDQGVIVLEQSEQNDTRLFNQAVGGIKYDFVNGCILRGEYILNQAGYDKTEHDLALAAFRSTLPAELAVRADNTRRLLAPGLELPGQRYVYGSLHVPDLLSIIDLNLDARVMASVRDGSSSSYGELGYRIGDYGTLSLAEEATSGGKDTELRGSSSPTHVVAYRHDW